MANKYHYKECGLENVWLLNGFYFSRTPYGKTVRIENTEGLHKTIGCLLAEERKKLNGREFRFLRHELTMSQNTLASLFGIGAQTIARWEKNEIKIPRAEETLIRKLYLEKMGKRGSIKKLLDEIADLEDKIDRLTFEEKNDVWRIAA